MGAVSGGNATENADIIRKILDGEEGAKKDMVLLNASAAFVAAGLCDGFKAGLELARDSIESGKAREKLNKLVELTQKCKAYTRDEPMGI
jgi:anthranilate phosphoribosyltransferase